MGVEFLHGVENFHQGEVLSVQAACNFVRPAEKMHFMQLFARIFFRYLYKDFQKKINNHKHHFCMGCLFFMMKKKSQSA